MGGLKPPGIPGGGMGPGGRMPGGGKLPGGGSAVGGLSAGGSPAEGIPGKPPGGRPAICAWKAEATCTFGLVKGHL